MRIGIGIGLPTVRAAAPVGAPQFPPVLNEADLILDSRQGVVTDDASGATEWHNQGTGGSSIDWVGIAPYFQLITEDPEFNAKPSLEQLADAGKFRNPSLTILSYLHDGSPFTLVGVALIVPDGTEHGILISAGNLDNTGAHFIVDTNDELRFSVFNGDGVGTTVRLAAAWPSGINAFAVTFDGTTYRMYIDGVEVTDSLVIEPHGTSRNVSYDIGGLGPGEHPAALDGKLAHLTMWSRELSPAERTEVSDYLLETFKP